LVGERSDYQVYSMDVSLTQLSRRGRIVCRRPRCNYAELYDLKNPGPARKITGYKSDIENINFTPDGKASLRVVILAEALCILTSLRHGSDCSIKKRSLRST